MTRSKRLIDPPRDPRGLPADEPFSPEEQARRWAELGRVLLDIAHRCGYLPPEREAEQ